MPLIWIRFLLPLFVFFLSLCTTRFVRAQEAASSSSNVSFEGNCIPENFHLEHSLALQMRAQEREIFVSASFEDCRSEVVLVRIQERGLRCTHRVQIFDVEAEHRGRAFAMWLSSLLDSPLDLCSAEAETLVESHAIPSDSVVEEEAAEDASSTEVAIEEPASLNPPISPSVRSHSLLGLAFGGILPNLNNAILPQGSLFFLSSSHEDLFTRFRASFNLGYLEIGSAIGSVEILQWGADFALDSTAVVTLAGDLWLEFGLGYGLGFHDLFVRGRPTDASIGNEKHTFALSFPIEAVVRIFFGTLSEQGFGIEARGGAVLVPGDFSIQSDGLKLVSYGPVSGRASLAAFLSF